MLTASLCLLPLLLAVGAPSPGEEATQPITRPETILKARNPRALDGQKVEFTGVRVGQMFTDRVITITLGGRDLVVRLASPLAGLKLAASISLTGVITQMPNQLQGWDLPPNVGRAVLKHPVFINVTKAQLQKPPVQKPSAQSAAGATPHRH